MEKKDKKNKAGGLPNDSQIPIISPSLAYRIIENEAVIINPLNGMVYTLNPTGSFIWELCDGEKSIHEIAQAVQNLCGLTYDEIKKDLSEFLGELHSRGLIKWKDQ